MGKLYLSQSEKEEDKGVALNISRHKSTYKASVPLFYSESPVDFSVQANGRAAAAAVRFRYNF
jgi:hypothetical protein